MTLYFITGNPGKFKEAKKLLPQLKQLDIDLPEIQHSDPRIIVKEKLLEAMKHKKGEFMIDDTSLSLEAMNGLPGPLIKWFLDAMGVKGIYNLGKKLGNTKATVMAIIGYANKKGEIYFFEGVVEGHVVSPKGSSFGWDPCFKPNGEKKTYGQMSKKEKGKISHRTKAIMKLKEFLDS